MISRISVFSLCATFAFCGCCCIMQERDWLGWLTNKKSAPVNSGCFCFKKSTYVVHLITLYAPFLWFVGGVADAKLRLSWLDLKNASAWMLAREKESEPFLFWIRAHPFMTILLEIEDVLLCNRMNACWSQEHVIVVGEN